MWYVLTGAMLLAIPGVFALVRARREFAMSGRVSRVTFFAMFVSYLGHTIVTLVSAWQSVWPLPLNPMAAQVIGGSVGLVGFVVYLTARVQFRSFRLAWGLETNQLVTAGIYKFSRNPQMMGWVLFLVGVGLALKSGAALLLVLILFVGVLTWLPVEERFLEQRFGEQYRQYRDSVPRFIGQR